MQILRCKLSHPLAISSGKTYKISVTFNESGCCSNYVQLWEVNTKVMIFPSATP
jgi:hypothetical protein